MLGIDHSKKRPRQEDTVSRSPPPSGKVHHLFNDADADILLQSSDGTLFAIRSLYLVAASSVFDDMFRVGGPGVEGPGEVKVEGQASPRILPRVRLDESGPHLAEFLTWIHPRTIRRIQKTDMLRHAVQSGLFETAFKYDAKMVLSHLFAEISVYAKSDTENVLAIGIIYGSNVLVQSSFWQWMDRLVLCRGLSVARGIDPVPRSSVDPDPVKSGRRHRNEIGPTTAPPSIGFVLPELLSKLPPGVFHYLAVIDRHVLFHEYPNQHEVNKYFQEAYKRHFPIQPCSYHVAHNPAGFSASKPGLGKLTQSDLFLSSSREQLLDTARRWSDRCTLCGKSRAFVVELVPQSSMFIGRPFPFLDSPLTSFRLPVCYPHTMAFLGTLNDAANPIISIVNPAHTHFGPTSLTRIGSHCHIYLDS